MARVSAILVAMELLTPETWPHLLGALAVGAVLGWLLGSISGKRRIDRLTDDWHLKLDDAIRQRDTAIAESKRLRTTIEAQQAVVHKHEMAVSRLQTEVESAREKDKLMTKNLFTLRAEREEFKSKLQQFQNALVSVKHQAQEYQSEFVKARDFYKGELTKSFDIRKALESKLEDARAEQESFSNLLKSSRSEQESINKMLEAAHNRLANLDHFEQRVIELEAENAQLSHDARLAEQKIQVLQRDVDEMDELKVQNKELAHCLKSMEASRKQYENDAMRYRKQADETEQKSETLRMRLDDVEKQFLEMGQQQEKAIKAARKSSAKKTNGNKQAKQEKDDLQAIVGIGKVFEHALHELGIYSYRQIANFGVSDIARVNMALKESKGRLEQDDWIGQARELHFKKYGEHEKPS